MSLVEDLILAFQTRGTKEAATETDLVTGAVKRSDEAAKKATASHNALGKSFGGLKGLAQNAAGAVGIGGLALGIGESIKNAQNLQGVQAQLGASIKANVHKPAADATNQMTDFADSLATHGGFATTQALQGMSQFVRVTGNVKKAEEDMTLATNVARGAHVSLAQAQRSVMMAEQGRTTGLARLGINIRPITTATQELAAHTKHATVEQKDAAKQADQLATKNAALAAMTKQYTGATATYSHTAAGGINNLRNSVEILSTSFGKILLPIVVTVTHVFVSLVGPLKTMLPVILALAAAWAAYQVQQKLAAVWTAITNSALVRNTAAAIANAAETEGMTAATAGMTAAQGELNVMMDANPIGIVIIAIGALVAAFIMAYTHIKWFRDMVNAIWEWLKTAFASVVQFIKAHVVLLMAIFFPLPTAMFEIVKLIITHWKGIVDFFTGLPGTIANALSSLASIVAKPFTDAYNAVHGVVEQIWKDFSWLVQQIVQFFTNLPNMISGAIGSLGSVVGSGLKKAVESIPVVGGLAKKIGLQEGGTVTQTGQFLVGERGPELVSLPRGAAVTPNAALGGSSVIVINNLLDGKLMSKSIIRQGLLQQSRGG